MGLMLVVIKLTKQQVIKTIETSAKCDHEKHLNNRTCQYELEV